MPLRDQSGTSEDIEKYFRDHAVMRTLRIASDDDTLRADLYGELPARRAAILVHGQSWDASGWRDIAPHFAARSVPALALNLRGYDGSSGTPHAPITIPTWVAPGIVGAGC